MQEFLAARDPWEVGHCSCQGSHGAHTRQGVLQRGSTTKHRAVGALTVVGHTPEETSSTPDGVAAELVSMAPASASGRQQTLTVL